MTTEAENPETFDEGLTRVAPVEKFKSMTTVEKIKICSDCKQEPATINYAESILDLTHGFNRWICQKCYNNIRDNNIWYKQGFQTGENSKHKSDLQQELVLLKDLWVKGYGTAYDSPRVFLEARINLIEKELKEIK